MMSKHPQPESSNFFSLRQNARLPHATGGHASTCQLELPKASVWWAEQAPNISATIEKSGHRSGPGAIALNSNDKVEIQDRTVSEAMSALQHRQTPTCSLPSTKPRLRVLFSSSMMMQTSAYCRHQKAFASDENKSDRRAFRKPQLPSELRKSDFEVEGQRLTSANEKALF
jgi:hypothetical protein